MSQEVINGKIILFNGIFSGVHFEKKVMTFKIQFILMKKSHSRPKKTEMKIVLRDDCRSNSIKN